MNTYIVKKNGWTLKEIEKRSQYFSDRALNIWGYAETDYKPVEKQLESYTLEDEEVLSGRLIAQFNFRNSSKLGRIAPEGITDIICGG